MLEKTYSVPELLAPAGDMECLQAAVRYGADAVYLGGERYGMRSSCANFDLTQLAQAVDYAHSRGVRVYFTCNTLPRNSAMEQLPGYLQQVAQAGVDAFIIADLGVLWAAKQAAPQVAVHFSTQAGAVSFATARAMAELGAARVVLARELALDEIAEIRAKTPASLELECFVHGSMCVSFSGRCLLSEYLTGRDANRGDCAQPCRRKYAVMEEKRPGRYFPLCEDGGGTYLFNSHDLCMAPYLDRMIAAGVSSLKIEGRAKSAYYVAVVTNAYRWALDEYRRRGPAWSLDPWIGEELQKISHRPYSAGFYLGGTPGQETSTGGYIREYEVAAVCEEWQDGMARLRQRNRFFAGDELDVLAPGQRPFLIQAQGLLDEDKNPIESAPHATQVVYLPSARPIPAGALLRRKRAGDT